MTKKIEAVEVFVELLESKLDEGQLQKCDNKSAVFHELINKYDGWFVKEHFYLNDKGKVTFPLGVEQLKYTPRDKQQFNRSLEDSLMRFTITNDRTGKESSLNFSKKWFEFSSVNREALEQAVENIKNVLDSEEGNKLIFLYSIEGGELYYLITTTSAEKFVSNHDCTYDTMLERKKRADYALELLEIEDAIYHLSQKRKQVKAALERTNFSFTSDRNRFLK